MKSLYALIFLLAIGIIFVPFASFAQVPFGGKVTAITPCDTGELVYVLTFKGIIPFMWLTGELPYLNRIPPHPGQELLGKAAAAEIPCIVGVVPIGMGLPIMFHGDSF